MVTATDLLILALATWRLSHMLVFDEGPGDVFDGLRRLAGVPKAPPPKEERKGLPFFAKLFICPLCVSVWVALAMWNWWSFELVAPWVHSVIIILAISGASSIISLWVQK